MFLSGDEKWAPTSKSPNLIHERYDGEFGRMQKQIWATAIFTISLFLSIGKPWKTLAR